MSPVFLLGGDPNQRIAALGEIKYKRLSLSWGDPWWRFGHSNPLRMFDWGSDSWARGWKASS